MIYDIRFKEIFGDGLKNDEEIRKKLDKICEPFKVDNQMKFNTDENRDSWFKEQGFERKEFFDKNIPTSDVDDLKFVEFTKAINDIAGIDVTYCYELVNGYWFLIETNAYFDQIKMNVRTVDELKNAVEMLKNIFGKTN